MSYKKQLKSVFSVTSDILFEITSGIFAYGIFLLNNELKILKIYALFTGFIYSSGRSRG